ncbi:Ig-specific serine endopeptidase MIP [Mycoplasma bradburyae]|uniref:Ig-specific serine endopeptidase MIP n=1 Tax=Mycoplasma bradburyae TaxID=2963128 RepID=UPI00233FFB4E|nr:DUF31 family protein [Mycoplasma bradburyae]MDC4182488.1 DUF31 family protein [Mycoplasma bradburyae]
MPKAKLKKIKYLFTLLSASSIIVASCKNENSDNSSKKSEDKKSENKDNMNPNEGNIDGGGDFVGNNDPVSVPNTEIVGNLFDGDGPDAKRKIVDRYQNYDAYVNVNNVNSARGIKKSEERSTPDAGVTNPFDIPEAKLKAYDEKAKKLGLPTYRDAFGYNFFLPDIDDEGNITPNKLVKRKDQWGPNLIPSYNTGLLDGVNFKNLDDKEGFLGLPRTILNDKYRKFSRTVYSFQFSNDYPDRNRSEEINSYSDEKKIELKLQSHLGTAWIFDYQLPEEGHYPTTWYFASNLHVLENLLLPDIAGTDKDFRGFEKRDYEARTNFANLTFVNSWNQDATPTGSRFATAQFNAITTITDRKGENFQENPDVKTEDQFNKISTPYVRVALDPKNIKPIFLGNDFLKESSTPKFDGAYKDAQTMIDFGVVEIKFNDENIAKWVTGDYANWKPEDKYKFATTSLLNDETYKNLKKNDIYAIGYPNSYDDYKIRYAGADGMNILAAKENVSYWINKSGNYYNNARPIGELAKYKDVGGDLSWSNTRTFANKPGVTDLLLSYSSFGGQPNVYSRMPYVNTGLGYMLDNFVPSGGASGTRVIDGEGNIRGILYGVAKTSTSGYVTALRSEGMDYQGLYGGYNLPQYDVIFGGGKDQKDSYLNQMKKRNPNVKTYLFPNGITNTQIPAEYQFANTPAAATPASAPAAGNQE